MEQLIIGTAGHVDHGKTVLIRALTGIDTDRLQEEKERGISIDLGFAPFRLPSGRLAGVVDVPGHERFIHNMLAGASGMDLVMLVVDATEGVMPQTREHLDILQLLGVQNGIVVITKIDLVEEEWRELVQEEMREELIGTFLEKAPLVAVSALKGFGIEQLKALIDQMTAAIELRSVYGPLRLPVDRSFIIAGFGTVVTGTLIQGSVKVGDTIAVVPPGLEARVRNIQVHDADVNEAQAGARVALNLSGLEKDQVLRGSVISSPGSYQQTTLLDASLQLLGRAPRPLKNLDPVHFFLGTARVVAKLLLLDRDELKPGDTAYVQCRLDRPLVAERGDPFVIRSYSPMTTIGGGKILDPSPDRHRRYREEVVNKLSDLNQDPQSGGNLVFLRSKLDDLVIADLKTLLKETRLDQGVLEALLDQLIVDGTAQLLGHAYILSANLQGYKSKIVDHLGEFHQRYPLAPGISRAQLKSALPVQFTQRDYDAMLTWLAGEDVLQVKQEVVLISDFKPEPREADRKILDQLEDLYQRAKLQPPSLKEVLDQCDLKAGRKDEIFNYLTATGKLIKVSEELYFHQRAYQEALEVLRSHFSSEKEITLAQFRDQSGTSRKYAQALLEYYDQQKLTRRIDDHRVPFKL